MTVAGKGGRPRKWSSDADRVRAFRARERGDVEPATVGDALAQDEGHAVAWAQVRQLTELIDKQKANIRDLEREVRDLRRWLAEEERRLGGIDAENKQLRARLAAVNLADPPPPSAPLPAEIPTVPDPPTFNRAQRRRSERRSRKLGR